MKIRKRVLAKLDGIYAVCAVEIEGNTHLIAATEQHGPCLLFRPSEWKISKIWDGPGGTMSILPSTKEDLGFLAIQKFFPVYEAERACIVYARKNKIPTNLWNMIKIADLPFVHRIEILETNKQAYLIASTLCGGKHFENDWSIPGAVFLGRIPENPSDNWTSKPILEGISRNHGLHVTELNGCRVVLVCGMQGLFKLNVPEKMSSVWSHKTLINHEVSEAFVADLDDDGRDEIVTIEPFHGNNLNVYRLEQGQWNLIFKKSITFGHALWAGKILNRSCIIVGNRGGEKDLTVLFPEGKNTLEMHSVVIDKGIGPASLVVIHKRGYELVFSANHGCGEAVLYEITP